MVCIHTVVRALGKFAAHTDPELARDLTKMKSRLDEAQKEYQAKSPELIKHINELLESLKKDTVIKKMPYQRRQIFEKGVLYDVDALKKNFSDLLELAFDLQRAEDLHAELVKESIE